MGQTPALMTRRLANVLGGSTTAIRLLCEATRQKFVLKLKRQQIREKLQGTRLGLNVKYVEQCSKKSEKNEFHSSENV